jgi:hypothetical protein
VGSTSGALTYVTPGTCTIEATQSADAADGDGVRTNSASVAVSAPTAPLNLGTAVNYSVLGGTGVTSTGDTVLNGDLGVGPASLIAGFPPGLVNGSTHLGDPEAVQAQSDLVTAYTAAAARTPTATFAGDQNGTTFDAGVYYTAAAFSLTGTMTLDGQGDPNAVFIFQVNAALSTAAASTVKLINGAQASNVFWQVNGAVGTGAASAFSGTIMADGAITVGAAASLNGAALSYGLVTLGDNTITAPDALTFTSPPTPTKALTTTTTDTVLAAGTPNDTGTITYASNTPSVCTVGSTSGALTYVTPGTCTIEATQSADAAKGYASAYAVTSFPVTVPLSYTVTFMGNGSSGGTTVPETDNAPSALTLNGFTLAAYTFAGWNTAADGSGTAYADGSTFPFTADTTLFAQWTSDPSYTVTFLGNGLTAGTTAPETDNVPSALTPNGFSLIGYSFAGWNTVADGSGTAYADGSSFPFTADANLFAQWTTDPSYTVTFMGNGSTAGTTAPETDNVPSALTPNGFSLIGDSFAGWNTAADGSGTAYADGSSFPFTADATLFAQWTVNPSYTVTFMGNGSTAGTTAAETDHAPTALTPNGFSLIGDSFAGWNTSADGSGTAYADGAIFPFTADANLFAQWAVNPSYTVTFLGNGSTRGATAPETDHAPSALTPNAFKRAGYAFEGWNTAADGSGTAYADGSSFPFTADANLFAQWTVNASYTVTFMGNGSTKGATAPETDHAPSALRANDYRRTGYAFEGWNTAANGSGTAYANGAIFPFTADATLFAQWTVNASYTVTFLGNGSTKGATAPETDHAPSALTPNGFRRAGYTFASWNTAADGSGTAHANGSSFPFTADATLFAQWTVKPSYTVTFMGNGSTKGATAPETDHAPSALRANDYRRAGYAFEGWNTAADASGTAYANEASFPFTGDATLFAQWTVKPRYTVTFMGNGSTRGATAPETHYAPGVLRANDYRRAGHTFAGWNTAANGSGTAYANGANFPFTADATLFAQWTVKPVTWDGRIPNSLSS